MLISKRIRGQFWRLWQSRYLTLVAVLILTLFFGTLSSRYFWTTDNLQTALTNFFVELAFVTIGQTLVILVRGIDLSVGGTAALSSITIGLAYSHGLNIWCALALGLLVGGACGTINGCLVTLFRTPPMIATLGSGLLYLGIVYGVTRGRPYSDFPASFQTLGQGQIGASSLGRENQSVRRAVYQSETRRSDQGDRWLSHSGDRLGPDQWPGDDGRVDRCDQDQQGR